MKRIPSTEQDASPRLVEAMDAFLAGLESGTVPDREAFLSGYPEIAVADNGVVGVLYIDYDDSGPATIFRHRFARSFNDGATWTDQILQSMDPGPIFNAVSGWLWGD